MSEKRSRGELKKMMRRHGGPGNPSIDKLEAEVRSDAFLPITRSEEISSVKKSGSGTVKRSGTHHVGTFVLEWGFDIPFDQVELFHQWLKDNEANLAKCPAGIAYRGTFIATFGPMSRPEGRYRTYWSLDELKNLESFAPTGRKTAFSKALTEFMSYRDVEKGTGYSQLFQVAAGTPKY